MKDLKNMAVSIFNECADGYEGNSDYRWTHLKTTLEAFALEIRNEALEEAAQSIHCPECDNSGPGTSVNAHKVAQAIRALKYIAEQATPLCDKENK